MFEWTAEEAYKDCADTTYGGVENLVNIKEAATNDADFEEFCRVVLDGKSGEIEDIYECDLANEEMSGSTVLNRYDRCAIKYNYNGLLYPLYIRWFAEDDCHRAYNIFYGRQDYSLGNFELVKMTEHVEPRVGDGDGDVDF